MAKQRKEVEEKEKVIPTKLVVNNTKGSIPVYEKPEDGEPINRLPHAAVILVEDTNTSAVFYKLVGQAGYIFEGHTRLL